jgi:hypothetical protein
MANDSRKPGDVSRRSFLKGTVAAGAAVATGGAGLVGDATGRGRASEKITWANADCIGSRDLALTNGKFVDHRGEVATALTIKDGRIVDVGQARNVGPCTLRINLRGRTVVPGLIDSSAHFTRTGCNPGFETRWTESAFSIAELQQVIADRAKTVPPGRDNFHHHPNRLERSPVRGRAAADRGRARRGRPELRRLFERPHQQHRRGLLRGLGHHH